MKIKNKRKYRNWSLIELNFALVFKDCCKYFYNINSPALPVGFWKQFFWIRILKKKIPFFVVKILYPWPWVPLKNKNYYINIFANWCCKPLIVKTTNSHAFRTPYIQNFGHPYLPPSPSHLPPPLHFYIYYPLQRISRDDETLYVEGQRILHAQAGLYCTPVHYMFCTAHLYLIYSVLYTCT